MKFFPDKKAAAAYVEDMLTSSKQGSRLTTTIIPVMYGGFYVSTATEESSEDIELQRASFFSQTQVNT